MRAEIYCLPYEAQGRIGVMPRPRGGDWLEDEIRSLRDAGVDVIVSLLTEDEAVELNLAGEQSYCRTHDVVFHSFPILDRSTPPLNQVTAAFIHRLAELLKEGRSLAIHCRAGIGRASLIAASVLAVRGVAVNEAFALIEAARRCTVPDTPEQRAWVAAFAQSPHGTAPISS